MITVTALDTPALIQLPPLSNDFAENPTLAWTTPRIDEIAVGLEINSYACAEVQESLELSGACARLAA